VETKIIQITAGKGPAECCLAVALAQREFIKEALAHRFSYELVHRQNGPENGTLYSVTLKLKGQYTQAFLDSWCGPLLWISQSPYRTFHKRKNWFIGVHVYDVNDLPGWNEQDVSYQTMRASGPGGQNVNKVESAVRAIHTKSGLQVTASESRSQVQNKKLALQKLKEVYEQWQVQQLQNATQSQWWQHHNLERGNPNRVYAHRTFKLEKINGNIEHTN
jgi:peptide chain release factor